MKREVQLTDFLQTILDTYKNAKFRYNTVCYCFFDVINQNNAENNHLFLRAEEENELFLKASLFMFQCFLSLLISLTIYCKSWSSDSRFSVIFRKLTDSSIC